MPPFTERRVIKWKGKLQYQHVCSIFHIFNAGREPKTSVRPCLDKKKLDFCYYSTFVCIWQILSNHHGLTRLKRLSRKLQTNCIISYFFLSILMLHACAARFDVMGNLEKFLDFGWK